MVLYVFSMYCPQRLLKTLRFSFLLDFEWRMGDALPDHRLVAPVARRRTADAACAEVAVVETEIVGGQEQVLRTGLREHIQAVGPRPADLAPARATGTSGENS